MSNLKEMFKDWGEYYRTATPPKVERIEYRSVELSEPVILQNGKPSRFLKAGDQLKAIDGIIVPCYGGGTHIVVGIFGTMHSTRIEIELFEIETKETITIKL